MNANKEKYIFCDEQNLSKNLQTGIVITNLKDIFRLGLEQNWPVFYLCLRTCLETVLAKTVLRQVSDRWRCRFSICLRQKTVLQIQTHVLVDTLAPIKYLICLKTSINNRNFIFMKCILILWNCCSMIEHIFSFGLFVTQSSILYFQFLRRVTCGTLVTPVQLFQNVLRQLQVTECADLTAV